MSHLIPYDQPSPVATSQPSAAMMPTSPECHSQVHGSLHGCSCPGISQFSAGAAGMNAESLMDPNLRGPKTRGAMWVAAQDSGAMESSSPLPQPRSCPMPGGPGSWGSLAQQAESKLVLRMSWHRMSCGLKQDPDQRDQSAVEAECGWETAGFQLPECTGPELKLFWTRN